MGDISSVKYVPVPDGVSYNVDFAMGAGSRLGWVGASLWTRSDTGLDLRDFRPTHVECDVRVRDVDPPGSTVQVRLVIGTEGKGDGDSLGQRETNLESLTNDDPRHLRLSSELAVTELANVVRLLNWTVRAPAEGANAAQKFTLEITNIQYVHEESSHARTDSR